MINISIYSLSDGFRDAPPTLLKYIGGLSTNFAGVNWEDVALSWIEKAGHYLAIVRDGDRSENAIVFTVDEPTTKFTIVK